MLKVPSSKPMPQIPMDGGQDMAPMGGADPMMGGQEEMPPMGEEDPTAGAPMGGDLEQNNDFGGNFDAGVEADEETDPEKFIQQLTGKLSQTLKKYNDENQDDESGLNKYVAGMIATQASKGLTDSEKDEIIKKINAGDVDEEPSDDEMPEDEMGNERGDEMEAPEEIPMESKKYRFSKKQIMENLMTTQEPRGRNNDERKEVKKSPKVKNSVRNKPFNAPKFK